MNILKAEAFANQKGDVLDTFCFRRSDANARIESCRNRIALKSMIRRAVLGKEDVQRLLRGRARPAGSAPNAPK